MGICSSCLGRRKGQNSETSRLLYDDPYRSHYGTTGQASQRQPDPEAQRREREALEGICHAMSDDVVDVFSTLPKSDIGGSSGSGKGHDQRLENSDTSTKGHKHPVSLKVHKREDNRLLPEEMAYRTVRRAPAKSDSPSPNGQENWEAAKAVMG